MLLANFGLSLMACQLSPSTVSIPTGTAFSRKVSASISAMPNVTAWSDEKEKIKRVFSPFKCSAMAGSVGIVSFTLAALMASATVRQAVS